MAAQSNRTKDKNGNAMGSDVHLYPSGGNFFEIQVKGHLDNLWSDWFEGLEMRLLDNGEMILLGPIADQAALMGILNKLSRLNLALISVNQAVEKK